MHSLPCKTYPWQQRWGQFPENAIHARPAIFSMRGIWYESCKKLTIVALSLQSFLQIVIFSPKNGFGLGIFCQIFRKFRILFLQIFFFSFLRLNSERWKPFTNGAYYCYLFLEIDNLATISFIGTIRSGGLYSFRDKQGISTFSCFSFLLLDLFGFW